MTKLSPKQVSLLKYIKNLAPSGLVARNIDNRTLLSLFKRTFISYGSNVLFITQEGEDVLQQYHFTNFKRKKSGPIAPRLQKQMPAMRHQVITFRKRAS